jgi:putative peptide zinc metalloprotease protein
MERAAMRHAYALPRLRTDLEWIERRSGRGGRWIVRDPLSLKFYYFSDRERELLIRFDGGRTLAEVVGDWVQSGRGSSGWCQRLLASALEHHLLTGAAPGAGRRMLDRSQKRRRSKWLTAPLQLLAIRVPLLDPSALLQLLEPLARLVFSRMTGLFLAVAAVGLLLALPARWGELADSTGAWQTLLQGDRMFAWIACYLMMKSLHELCHALACRRWGAECHEMGLFLFVFMPCLYCDVSDVWKLERKWPRLMVSAAGVLAELAVAVVAGWVWLLSQPGPVQAIALNLMLLGAVSTLLVNGNPLLRYDGYYLLSDWWEVPNLSDQARQALWGPLQNWLSGGQLTPPPLDAPAGWLIAYAIGAIAYRTLVLALIFMGLYHTLGAAGLQLVAGSLISLSAAGLALSIAVSTRRGVANILNSGPPLVGRWLALIVAIASVAIPLFAWPYSLSIEAVGLVRGERLEPVYAAGSGWLQAWKPIGSKVAVGDLLVELDSPEDRLAAAKLRGDIAVLQKQLRNWESRRSKDAQAELQLSVTQQLLQSRQEQLQTIEQELERLQIRARQRGSLVEPGWLFREASDATDLSGWRETPLRPANRGAWIERGTLLAWVTQFDAWTIEAFVGEEDIVEIQPAALVRIRLDQQPNLELLGTVHAINSLPLAELPPVLIHDRRLPTRGEPLKPSTTEQTTYRITIIVGHPLPATPHGALASVRIAGPPMTSWQRLKKIARRTLKLPDS